MANTQRQPDPGMPTTLLEMEPATSRWHVRAQSIKECVGELARVWTAAGAQADERNLSDEARGEAMGDPRLAAHMTSREPVPVRMRTSVLTLVVDRATAGAIGTCAGGDQCPSPAPSFARHRRLAGRLRRAVDDGRAHLRRVQLNDRSGSEMCTEQILIKTGGELSQHLARVVTPLLIHDLPVVLWWPDDPPFGSRQFNAVVGTADRLLVDSGSSDEDGGKRLAGMATVVSDGITVCDIGWLRLNLWRELLAEMFDHPLLTSELDHINSVRVDVARLGQHAADLEGRLLPWLARGAPRLGGRAAPARAREPDDDTCTRRCAVADARSGSRCGPCARRSTAPSARPARSSASTSRPPVRARRFAHASPASRTTCSRRPTGTAHRSPAGPAASSHSTRRRSLPRRSTSTGTGPHLRAVAHSRSTARQRLT